MTTTAIIQRELVVTGRRGSTYRSRCILAALIALVVVAFLGFSGSGNPGALSRTIFSTLTWVIFAGAMLSGVFLTADALSSERRDGTLGLLFLTELSGVDVVVGKLIASSIEGAYALLGLLPVLAIPLMMGGVTGLEFGFTALAITAVLAASLGIGIFASTISRNTANAIALTILILTGLATLPLLAEWIFRSTPFRGTWLERISILSPVAAVKLANTSVSLPRIFLPRFGASLLVNLSYGLVGLAAAAWWLTRHWRSMASETGESTRTRRSVAASNPLAGAITPRRVRPDGNPYQWITERRLSSPRALQWLFGLSLMAWGGFYALCFILPRTSAIPCFIIAMFTAYGLHAVYKIQTALLATGQLAEEAAGGGLELLLSTPLTTAEIIVGHRHSVTQATHENRIRLTLVNLCLMLSVLNSSRLSIGASERSTFLILFLGGLVVLWVDTFAIVRLGAWAAVRTRRQSRAMLQTLLPTFLPTAICVLIMFLIASRGMRQGTPAVVFTFFFLGLILWALFLGIRADSQLAANFRSAAAGLLRTADKRG